MSGTVIHKPPNLSINPFSTSSKDIIQSYIVTTARYDFSVHEKRILYRIIECLQYQLKGKHLDKNFMISPDLYGMVRVTLPLSYLNPKKGKHISEDVKEALKTLQKKMIQYEDNGQCKEVKLIEPPIEQPLILGREVSFLLHQDAYELLLNFPKGFKRYELKTAMEFNSVYAMRFYELLSGQKKPLTYSTEKLKTMLKLENKYRDIRTFISRIIDHSKKELDQKSPYTFTYELEHEKERNQKGRKKISNIKFIPIYQPEHRNTDLALQEEQRSLDLSVALRPKELNIFLELGFSENELKTRHFVVIQDLHKAKEMDFRFPIFDMIDYVKKKENPRIYLITTLKNQIKEWKKKFQEQEENKLSEAAMKVKKERQRKQDKIIAFLQNCTTIPNSTFENEREQIIERIHDKGGILYLRKIYAACNGDKDRIMKKLMDNKIITK
ncbi:replication protein A (plasmid) [Candidatus Azobacteroides pseudotrichonymphae genomovar. CFP2]|uniref:Replication protein A n=2 Tax=Candidatus Azobacteroides TaxID=511434 RepID=B6YSC3_AZOPC|nr:replication protein A [Candidatus Azobacteroides pseudotrichonymphae genomovar. CFP2]